MSISLLQAKVKSADTKTNFEHLLIAKNSIVSVSDNIGDFIKEQDHFLKGVREYADKAFIVELTKVYNIIVFRFC